LHGVAARGLGQLAHRARNTVKVARLASALAESGVTRPDQVRIHHVEHHRAHLASAFFSSPFEEAAVVSIDGFGDFSSVMWGTGRGNRIEVTPWHDRPPFEIGGSFEIGTRIGRRSRV
jgi:predicted NodU family carbamoyl transferase